LWALDAVSRAKPLVAPFDSRAHLLLFLGSMVFDDQAQSMNSGRLLSEFLEEGHLFPMGWPGGGRFASEMIDALSSGLIVGRRLLRRRSLGLSLPSWRKRFSHGATTGR